MRWIWLDRVIELVPRERIVSIKHISLAEEHMHDHFSMHHEVVRDAAGGWWQPSAETLSPSATLIDCHAATPIMPASLIIEGMAQTAGILVGHSTGFQEKPVLAKISKAEINLDATAGQTIRHTATVERLDRAGASIAGVVEILTMEHDGTAGVHRAGEISLMFSYLDQNMGGHVFPEHNFVFSETFKTLLHLSGVDAAQP